MDASFVFKTDRPWPNARLKRAAIVGHVTAHTARVWFRTSTPGRFCLILWPANASVNDTLHTTLRTVPFPAPDTLPGEVRRFPFHIEDYTDDTTRVIELAGLDPDTRYRYALYGEDPLAPPVDGRPVGRIVLGQDRPYGFRTQPDAARPFCFSFYSCHMPYKEPVFGGTQVTGMNMWELLHDAMDRHDKDGELAFSIAGGDQVYVDGVGTLDIWKYLNRVMYRKDGEIYPGVEEMVSWYRDIYRGYWGFPSLQRVLSRFPTYMIWDDHEILDGWGSYVLDGGKDDQLDELFPDRKKRGLHKRHCRVLLRRMFEAATRVYLEYQHAHNPATPTGQYDYGFIHANTAVYVLDGRGHRDFDRDRRRILGQAQLKRFGNWLTGLDRSRVRNLFVVSAVPVLHLRTAFANADDTVLADLANLQDDLRDAWEHDAHKSERKALLKLLFDAAGDFQVSILSGDVHISAAFRMVQRSSGRVIHQLTSSAITYNKPRLLGWALAGGVPERGRSDDGYDFERLALYTDTSFAMVRVDTDTDQISFRLYGEQTLKHPDENQARPLSHAIARIDLRFQSG
ncbi:MAG TPA: alkaline phosphatase family protein [Gammaproteobacteria bacterium]|nr:alkaline phosphatase family protein [Gammaproteobacteria bacterium]